MANKILSVAIFCVFVNKVLLETALPIQLSIVSGCFALNTSQVPLAETTWPAKPTYLLATACQPLDHCTVVADEQEAIVVFL